MDPIATPYRIISKVKNAQLSPPCGFSDYNVSDPMLFTSKEITEHHIIQLK